MKGFEKAEKHTFVYWFAHWCAYQMTALVFHVWKPKYLLHDIEKPWLYLFSNSDKIKYLHTRNNKHHLQYKKGVKFIDYEAMVIDWECARFTKNFAPLNAKQMFNKKITAAQELYNYDDVIYFQTKLIETYNKLNL